MPQPPEAVTGIVDLRPESGADLQARDLASPSDDQARGLLGTRRGEQMDPTGADRVDEAALATGPEPAEVRTNEREVGPETHRIPAAGTVGRIGDLAIPSAAPPESGAYKLAAGGTEARGEQTDTSVIDPERVKAEIARSDAAVAIAAADEADRLERMLDDPNLTDLETRQSLTTAVTRLRATDTIHTTHLPDRPEDLRSLDTLHKPFGARDAGSLGDTTPSQPFVSRAEHDGQTPYTALERAAEFKHELTVEANRVGAPIRRAAMDKAPETIGKKPKVVSWTTTDPEVPGYEYTFDATFRPENGRPSLASVSCAFSPIKPRGTRMVDGLNISHALYTPLTVSAHFDGPSMTGLDLLWRHRSFDKSGTYRFGPAGEALAREDRGQLLAGLVRRVDEERAPATQGVIELTVGGDPRVKIRPRGSVFDTARRSLLTSSRFVSMIGQYEPTEYTYNAAQHAFLAPGTGGRTQIIDAEGVAGLMHDVARFFPLVHA